MNTAFWKGRRVLITGHTGFKGTWLSLWLQRLGAHVTGFALAPDTKPGLFEDTAATGAMSSVIGNVLDLAHLTDTVASARPEVIFHLAAQALVRASYEDPVGTYAVNVLGTVHLLEAVRRTPGVRSVVVVTSDKCYANREWIWSYREHEPLGGHDPYSSSKACAEHVAAAYRSSYFSGGEGPHIATARAGNVIGGGDWSRDRLVPDLMRAFSDGEPAVIRNPNAVRPWQHVLDPLGGYLLLAERLCDDASLADAWNFGPDDDGVRTVGWVADQLVRAWGGAASWRLDDRAHAHEAQLLRLDCSKARARLGWNGRHAIDEALDATVSWYREIERSADSAAALVNSQIDAYAERVACPAP